MKKRLMIGMSTACLLVLAGSVVGQNFRADPIYGEYTLQAGFSPDPQTFHVTAGGESEVRDLGLPRVCEGRITAAAPDLSINYEAGRFPITFFVRSEADTTLIINGPRGAWHCNDDTWGLNPRIRFSDPVSGQYDIWVGVIGERPEPAILHMTER